MSTVADIERFLVSLNPNGKLGNEEGALFGESSWQLGGLCVSWMATRDAIEFAVHQDCNVLVCHEALTWFDYPVWREHTLVKTPWPTDECRLELLRRHQIAVVRAHSTVDPTHVGPALWEALALPEPVWNGPVHSVHRLEATTTASLVARTREALGTGPLRVTGDPQRTISTLGIAWGGLGLDRHMDKWLAYLLPREVDAILVGETSDFAQRFADESEVVLIEAGHAATEDPGMRRLAADLAQAFPEVPVVHRAQGNEWTVV